MAWQRIVGLNVRKGTGKSIRSYVFQIRKNDSCSLEAKCLEDEYMGRWSMYACKNIVAIVKL